MEQSINQVKVTVLPDGRMDTKNAALYTGLKEKTMATMRSKGSGPSFTKRGLVFYFKSDIDKWLSGGEI